MTADARTDTPTPPRPPYTRRRASLAPRATLAILIGRASGGLARRLGISGGTSLPGLVAQYADPKLIRRLAGQARHGCVVVTGTNGKTTSSGLVTSVLRSSGLRVWRNKEGANLARGITTSLLRQAGPSGRLAHDGDGAFVFEVDEAALSRIAADLSPRVMVVTNLFRDQLDRYGEVDTVAERWRESLKNLPASTILALNADDPTVASLASDNPGQTLYYGVEETLTHDNVNTLTQVIDTRTCPRCRALLEFAPRFYSHIGHWSCKGCGYARPVAQISARVLAAGIEQARFELTTPTGSGEVTLALPGLYNVYNALAAAAVGVAMGVEFQAIVAGLSRFTPAFGRAEVIAAGDRNVRILLTKNPTGLNEVLRALSSDAGAGRKHLLMLLNDRAADGEDVSWIWDADFEQLAGTTESLTVSGGRALDLALRLKYAGEEPQRVERDVGVALTWALERTPPGETLFIIPTYTAMLAVRGELERRGYTPRYWEQDDE